jgi:hypothetical protein
VKTLEVNKKMAIALIIVSCIFLDYGFGKQVQPILG